MPASVNARLPFAGNNLTMRYLLHALNVLRIDVPGQIALAGFDDFDIADVLQPALTVVRQPVYQIGEMAANLLFQRISRGEFPAKGHRVVLPTELVLRRSCGCHRESSVTFGAKSVADTTHE